MTRSQRMLPIVKIAENHERDAAKSLGDSRQRLDRHEARLHELLAYRDEYSARLQNAGGAGMAAAKLHEYRTFLLRLDQAITQQRHVVERARKECEHKRQGWLKTHTRSQALEQLTERFVAEERRAAEQVEQKLSDERALRASYRSDD